MGPAAMIPEIDIWRSAQLMIRQYGDAAVSEADARATALGSTSTVLSPGVRLSAQRRVVTKWVTPLSGQIEAVLIFAGLSAADLFLYWSRIGPILDGSE